MKKLIYVLFAAIALSACSKFEELLDRPALTSVVDNNFWRGEGDVRLYVNAFYPLYFEGYGVDWDQNFNPVRGGTGFCDDFTSEKAQSSFTNKVPTSSGSSSEDRSCSSQFYGPGWGFGRIHKINILIDRLNEHKANFTEEEFKHWMSVAYFFKIYEYSDLVGVYGNVPYFETTVRDDDIDTQYKDRDNRQYVMDKVYDMCDYVLTNMRTDDGANNLNRYVAAAFISRFMLYEGTWQKYHDGEKFTHTIYKDAAGNETNKISDGNEEDKTEVVCDGAHAKKYLEMAVRAANVVMQSHNYEFSSSFKALFASDDLSGNKEVLLYRHYDAALNVFHCVGSYCAGQESQTGVNLHYIKEFICQDGKIWDKSTVPGADDFSVSKLVLTRDPRFFDTFYRQIDIHSSSMLYCYKYASYEALESYFDLTQSVQLDAWKGKYNVNDAPIMRLSEVVLNWIEAKAELAKSYGGPAVTQTQIDSSINAIRKRPLSPAASAAGVKQTEPLLLANVDAIDPGRDPDVPALIWEIRRERRMEFLHEGSRIKDLLRWKKLDYMNYDLYPDKFLGPWVNFPVETVNDGTVAACNRGFLDKKKNLLQVTKADGSVVKYNGSNEADMVGFYNVENASNRQGFSNRSYMAPIGQRQIDEYEMRGYVLTQTERW